MSLADGTLPGGDKMKHKNLLFYAVIGIVRHQWVFQSTDYVSVHFVLTHVTGGIVLLKYSVVLFRQHFRLLLFVARHCADARYCYSNSIHLSVRYVPVFYTNGLTYCHSFFTTQWPSHSSFISIKHLRKIPMRSPPVRALNTGRV